MDMKQARAALFGRIEREILPDAEKRIQAIRPFSVEGLSFGSRPTAKAFGAEGDLRFDVGLWDGARFVPFAKQILFPLDDAVMPFDYPKELKDGWRNIYAHYTPVTRRLDRVEIHDYFSANKVSDKLIRAQALGHLAAEIARKFPAEQVVTSVSYVRYAEQYMVITGVTSRAFAAAGAAETAAMGMLA